jgi:hypothetical protein
MTRNQSPLLDLIYSPEVLAEQQLFYPRFFQGFYREIICPQFSTDEMAALHDVRFVFPLTLRGQEPFGFFGANGTINFSIASLKFLNDLLLAYCWLGVHGYQVVTINDYLLMLAHWQSDSDPPEPLRSLGIRDGADRESGVSDLHLECVKSAYLFILLHELAHRCYRDPPIENISRADAQAQEMRADRFALDILARLGLLSGGIQQFFIWEWAFMPDPNEYPDDGAYWSEMQKRTHPLTRERLLQVSNDIERNATARTDQKPETLSKLQDLARELRKIVSLHYDANMVRIAAQRGRMLKAEDLAPRRPNELIAMPLGADAGQRPFHGKCFGSFSFRNISSVDTEIVLQNRSGNVTGTIATREGLGRIDGVVTEGVLNFQWILGEMQGHGLLHWDASNYEGILGLGDSTSGEMTCKLCPAPIAAGSSGQLWPA